MKQKQEQRVSPIDSPFRRLVFVLILSGLVGLFLGLVAAGYFTR